MSGCPQDTRPAAALGCYPSAGQGALTTSNGITGALQEPYLYVDCPLPLTLPAL